MPNPHERFEQINPEVWKMFKEITFGLIKAGRTYYSSRDILPIIRWQTALAHGDGSGFKVNDHCSPYYARKFMRLFPEYGNFFRLRTSRYSKETK